MDGWRITHDLTVLTSPRGVHHLIVDVVLDTLNHYLRPLLHYSDDAITLQTGSEWYLGNSYDSITQLGVVLVILSYIALGRSI